MGGPELTTVPFPAPLRRGPVTVALAGTDPAPADVAGWFAGAHRAGRPVAVHCVSRAALALALAAWDIVGSRRGDRIEHGAVIPPELARSLLRHGITVVTRPTFVADCHRAGADPADQPHLYPAQSLIDHRIRLGGGTDAPDGDPDPWAAVRAAVHRTTPDGTVIGAPERLSPRRALDLFLTRADQPGGPPRTVDIGAGADLVLVEGTMPDILAQPLAERVRATIVGGTLAYTRR
jgi:predicted amidohydrolase YtcJ